MRKFRTLLQASSVCVLILVATATSFAQVVAGPEAVTPAINEGNGVERGLIVEWEDVASLIRPEMRKAIVQSLQAECPDLVTLLNGDILVVDSMKVLSGNSESNFSALGVPILELTLRLGHFPNRQFKVRMTAEPPRGFLSTDPEIHTGDFNVKIIEWDGFDVCFGLDTKLDQIPASFIQP